MKYTYIVTARHRGEILKTTTWELEAANDTEAEQKVHTREENALWPFDTVWSVKIKVKHEPNFRC
jgi:hypothetical protein